MCELLGLSFDAPVTTDVSIHEFASRGHENPDGWGLAWYPDQSVAVIKEAIPWYSSKHTDFLESYSELRSKIYIGHVRHKTVGGPVTHADTHPFIRELNGREYCFAHNGTLLDLPSHFPLQRFRPIGGTDSEYIFCHLLDAIATELGDLDPESSWHWLHKKFLSMNLHGRMNILFSDGQSLFCYHDRGGYKGLNWRLMSGFIPHTKRLEDEEITIELDVAPATTGVVVATCPLGGTGWASFLPGELLVLREGRVQEKLGVDNFFTRAKKKP